MPTFLEIGEWGGTPNGWTPRMTIPAADLWVHHSVTVRTGNPVADFRTLNQIGLSRGHGGISYSYAIEGDTIGEGQGTGRGAHTAGDGCNHSPWGWNPCSYGVVFVGNFDNDTLTDADINSFRWLRDEYLIPCGLLVPGVYPTGGHRDAPGNQTGCPGTNVENMLDVLRQPYVPPSTPKGPPLMTVMWIQFNGFPTYLVQAGLIVHQFDGAPSGFGIPQSAVDFAQQTQCGIIRMSGGEWQALLKRSGVG